LSISLVGQNLLDPAHAEYTSETVGQTTTLVPRTARLRLNWRL
jgi:hypothetical protein